MPLIQLSTQAFDKKIPLPQYSTDKTRFKKTRVLRGEQTTTQPTARQANRPLR